MTVPFSAARTGVPDGAAILMPVPLELAKSTMTLPVTGQRNLSAPDMAGSCRGIFGAAWGAVATCVAAGWAEGVRTGFVAALTAAELGAVVVVPALFVSTRPAKGTTGTSVLPIEATRVVAGEAPSACGS